MKAKYFIVYILVGAAFLAVSLWVYLSGGKSAKAVNAKYRLGGILLTAWSILSVVSCDVPGLPPKDGSDEGMIMCYDPIPSNYVSFGIKHEDTTQSYKYNQLSPGDIIVVEIDRPEYTDYVMEITSEDEEKTVLQRNEMTVQDSKHAIFDIPLSKEVTYKGAAVCKVNGKASEDDFLSGVFSIEIL